MILFFISLHHKTLPLLNKCAVSCWLSTVKKTRNGGSFKISLVHRMTSTNIKMYEVNLWQCNQSTWKSRKVQCTKYPKNGSNRYFRTLYILNNEKNHVLKDELANLKELTDWLSDPNSYCDLIIHLELALLFCDLPQGPEEHKPIKGSFFAAYDIFERIHLSLGTWPCISHKCCNFMNGNTNNLKQYSLPYNIDLDHELQNVATSCFKAAALSIFQRGHFTTCSSRGRRDVNTREF